MNLSEITKDLRDEQEMTLKLEWNQDLKVTKDFP